MISLKKLDARGDCGIDQNGIEGLDLVDLDVSHNPKIKEKLLQKKIRYAIFAL